MEHPTLTSKWSEGLNGDERRRMIENPDDIAREKIKAWLLKNPDKHRSYLEKNRWRRRKSGNSPEKWAAILAENKSYRDKHPEKFKGRSVGYSRFRYLVKEGGIACYWRKKAKKIRNKILVSFLNELEDYASGQYENVGTLAVSKKFFTGIYRFDFGQGTDFYRPWDTLP